MVFVGTIPPLGGRDVTEVSRRVRDVTEVSRRVRGHGGVTEGGRDVTEVSHRVRGMSRRCHGG